MGEAKFPTDERVTAIPDVFKEVVSIAPGQTVVTGSVAIGYQEGLALKQAILEARDFDVIVAGELPDEQDRELTDFVSNHPEVELQRGWNIRPDVLLKGTISTEFNGTQVALMSATNIALDTMRTIEAFRSFPAMAKHEVAEYAKSIRRLERLVEGNLLDDKTKLEAKKLLGEIERMKSRYRGK